MFMYHNRQFHHIYSSTMLRAMSTGINSPVRNAYGDRIHSDSVFFGPLSPSNANPSRDNPIIINDVTADNKTVTPVSMYNTSYNISKELQHIIEELRSELTEQREYCSNLTKTHNELQTTYHKDVQLFTKKLENASAEKHELLKDLDLALDVKLNKTIMDNDNNEYKEQMNSLCQQQADLKVIIDTVNNLSNQFQ
eukprot:233612_1